MDAKLTISDFNGKMGSLMVAKRYDLLTQIATTRFAPEYVMHKAQGPKLSLIDLAAGGEWEMKNAREGKGDGPVSYKTRLKNWRMENGAVVVDAHNDVVGEWLKDGRRLPVKFKSVMRETWIQRDGEWKALRFDELWVRGTVDGKPISTKA
ncbi:hypothetical protein EON82_13315 [bacterium]|nr:MAG: hypothetical protein EON82_13315 [bacterium]